MHRTLCVLAVCVCLGIVCGRLFRPDALAAFSVSSVLLFVSWRLQETRRCYACTVCVLALSCGCVLFMAKERLPGDDIQHILRKVPGRSYCELDALVAAPQEEKSGKISFLVEARSLRLSRGSINRCSGKVKVESPQPVRAACGQQLSLHGVIRLSWPVPVMRLVSSTQCRLVSQAFSLKGWAHAMKTGLCTALRSRLSGTSASVVSAMVLGEKRALSPFLSRQMVKTGTVHILVVSGFNVGIVCGLVLLFLKVVRVPRALRFILAAALIALYCLMCGLSTPVVRAGIMAIVCMFSRLVRRQADLLTACAFSALCILVCDPRQLFSPSFQLSYASVLSLVVIFPLIRSKLPQLKESPKACRFTLDAFAVSLSAWLGTSGFVAWYFGMVAPAAVLANIVIPALAALITLCGCLLACVHYVCPYLASPFVSAAEALVATLLAANSLFLQIPCSHFFFDKAKAL